MRDAELAGEEDARQVDADRLRPGLQRRFHRTGIVGEHDSGIVKHHVEPAELLRTLFDHRPAAFRIGDVTAERHRLAARGCDPGRHGLGRAAADIGEDQTRPFGRELHRRGLADAAARAADEGALTPKPHLYLSPCSQRQSLVRDRIRGKSQVCC
jgi:hypothetical protein